jgi:hypothetical protein
MERKKIFMIVGGIGLVIVIGVAAFLAGRLANQSAQSAQGPQGLVVSGENGAGMVTSGSFSMEIEPAPEIPTANPDAAGVVLKQVDNILTVGTGDASSGVMISSSVVTEGNAAVTGGAIQIDPMGSGEYSGPEVEVVVTKDTKIYRDATMDEFQGGFPEGNTKIQMKVEEITIDQLGSNSFISVWGRRTGDRIIADVILGGGGMVVISNP